MRGWEGVGWTIDEHLLRSGGLLSSPLAFGGLVSCHVSAISPACTVDFVSGRCGLLLPVLILQEACGIYMYPYRACP